MYAIVDNGYVFYWGIVSEDRYRTIGVERDINGFTDANGSVPQDRRPGWVIANGTR